MMRFSFWPNVFERSLKGLKRRGGSSILLAWNRGLGDLPLGLYAMVYRIREVLPGARVTFLTRPDLAPAFEMLEGVEVLVAPDWRRGQPFAIDEALKRRFDLVIEHPDPTKWVAWQLGKLTPRLRWKGEWDALWKKFPELHTPGHYVGVQVVAESAHGPWRNWPEGHWRELFDRLALFPDVKILLLGFGDQPHFSHPNVIDLRGKTTLFELLSIVKNRCDRLLLPDSGILSLTYFLDAPFPLRLVSLWADVQGVLKQNVPSPNPELVHISLCGERRNLASILPKEALEALFPLKPLQRCPHREEVSPEPLSNVGVVLLAGGQATRLGIEGPKGLFSVGGKPLFQWIAEKVAPSGAPLAIMTSPLNHDETVAFFQLHSHFGLKKVSFFPQEMGPLLNLDQTEVVGRGPNGNGSFYRSFVQSGIAEEWLDEGIERVSLVAVDNPLADPLDPELVTLHKREGDEVTLLCLERASSDGSMGVLAERCGRIEIVEYLDLPEGGGEYRYVNGGQAILSLPFILRAADLALPLHWVKKKLRGGEEIWKGEKFIFDAYPFAQKIGALCSLRHLCYAPVKDLKGVKGVEEALKQR